MTSWDEMDKKPCDHFWIWIAIVLSLAVGVMGVIR